MEDDIKYHKNIIKMARSLARLNGVSLAQEKEQDIIYYRLLGSVYK